MDDLLTQMKEACKAAGARWAARLTHLPEGWQVGEGYGLSKTRQKALDEYLAQPKTLAWLQSALASDSTRTRKLNKLAERLGCERVYVFPTPEDYGLLLVGVDELDRVGKELFRLLAVTARHQEPVYLAATNEEIFLPLAENVKDPGFAPEEALEYILASLARFTPCVGAYLAVRAGDAFRIETVWKLPAKMRGTETDLEQNKVVAEMVDTRQGVIVKRAARRRQLALKAEAKDATGDWMGVPVALGQRIIGYMAFKGGRGQAFIPLDLERMQTLAFHVAASIDNAIVFTEASRHLQQFALLNELASVTSVGGVNVDEVARRVWRMLRRTFRTDLVKLYLLESDGERLRSYAEDEDDKIPEYSSIEDSLAGYVLETGRSVRAGNVEAAPRYQAENREVKSALAVPLHYRGKVIGVLTLENVEADAFSPQDEQLLTVIASQLAGLIENVGLNEKARVRARNLSSIHQVVQDVVGLTDVEEIAGRATKLMVEGFDYDLAAVVLLDEAGENLIVAGVSGADKVVSPEGLNYARNLGVTSHVLESGESLSINDVSQDKRYMAVSSWQAGSVMCVPLRAGERLLGVVNVEQARKHAFSDNDLIALEALAGVLSSVIMYARRYEQLQMNVRQLEAVRETSLDISTNLDWDILLKRVVNRAKELLGAKGAELGLVDGDEKLVRVLVSENPWQDYAGYTFPFMYGVAGRVAATGEPMAVKNYNQWSGKQLKDPKAPFKSVASVPLKLVDEVIGTLTVYDDDPLRVFREVDLQILELLAPQVTVFIRNARLYVELEERIEAQRLVEERLIRTAKLAAVGEMAAGVAHELNNPLTTVAGFAELVLEELPEEFAQRADLELILQEALRARTVVRRLLDFSRQSELLRVKSDMNEIVSDVVTLVTHLANTSGVEMQIQFWNELPQVRIDRNQIKQVVLNLIHNALQAMPNGGKLHIETTTESREGADWVTVAVRDDGHGIEPENMQHIFEPFFTTKPTGSGTGLGLSISYGIVSDHGGYIEVDSEAGEGTLFTVWLPVIKESENVNA